MCPKTPSSPKEVAVLVPTSKLLPLISNIKCMNGLSESFAGICWFHRQSVTAALDIVDDEVDRLNELVRIKVLKFQEENDKHGIPLPDEVEAVVRDHLIVYQKRWTFIPFVFMIASSLLLLHNMLFHSTVAVATTVVFTFFYYDFLSGVLHIVLDNPLNIGLPVLKEPCLEFQWHHHIPADIASKPFFQVCGDLNLTVILLTVVYLNPWFGFGYYDFKSPLAISLVASKILFAYYGQLSHCMSHMPPPNRPQWVLFLQTHGFLISAKEHLIHHTNYNNNFCIGSGVCNPLISFIKSYIENRWVWISLLVLCLFFDIPLAKYLLTKYAGFE